MKRYVVWSVVSLIGLIAIHGAVQYAHLPTYAEFVAVCLFGFAGVIGFVML